MHLCVNIEELSKILPSEKDLVRQNILVFIAQVPPLLRYKGLATPLFTSPLAM